MSDIEPRLPWSEEQWAAAQQTVQAAARKARVASSFLPLHGNVPPGQSVVPALRMKAEAYPEGGTEHERLDIEDSDVLKLTTIACDVYLKTQQVEDPDLSAAMDLLTRAGDIIGRLEDAIVFNGQPAPDKPPPEVDGLPRVYTVRGGQKNGGLLKPNPDEEPPYLGVSGSGARLGEALVVGVVGAIQQLEENGYYGPFACVLGRALYAAATWPSDHSLVLPSDRIIPFTDGQLLRSSTIPDNRGVVVALAASPIDLVIGSDVHVKYLQLSTEPRYVLRVSERFVLRLKQPDAVCQLRTAQRRGRGPTP
ncbi:MAG TPA: family 1 encapsulin nanocompartment shell protein [Acidimicrobiales bacterium]|nr:family 1 encapsulin nanocompartment shell protein [Acidimicrobiales bacterium]